MSLVQVNVSLAITAGSPIVHKFMCVPTSRVSNNAHLRPKCPLNDHDNNGITNQRMQECATEAVAKSTSNDSTAATLMLYFFTMTCPEQITNKNDDI